MKSLEINGKKLAENGYVHLSGFMGEDRRMAIQQECSILVERHYNPTNIHKGSVYPSDTSSGRVSHAMMISSGTSTLPAINQLQSPGIKMLLNTFLSFLGDVLTSEISANARYMLNWQQYFGSSKPVRPHFDGEYLSMGENIDDLEKPIVVHEALVPRYVMLLTVANENTGANQGTVLYDASGKAVASPQSQPGDLLIFDNSKFFHGVPQLERPRYIVGLRSFDIEPLHFVALKKFALDSREYFPGCNGWFTGISSLEALDILAERRAGWQKKESGGLY